jgi:1-acyl-sn-glycerol-3-phosphate acyltransferase
MSRPWCRSASSRQPVRLRASSSVKASSPPPWMSGSLAGSFVWPWCALAEGHRGVALLAARARVPVVPAGAFGQDGRLPPGEG